MISLLYFCTHGYKRVSIFWWPTAWLCARWEAHLLRMLCWGCAVTTGGRQRSRFPMRMRVGDSTPFGQVSSVSREYHVNRAVLKKHQNPASDTRLRDRYSLAGFACLHPHAFHTGRKENNPCAPRPLVPLDCPQASSWEFIAAHLENRSE